MTNLDLNDLEISALGFITSAEVEARFTSTAGVGVSNVGASGGGDGELVRFSAKAAMPIAPAMPPPISRAVVGSMMQRTAAAAGLEEDL